MRPWPTGMKVIAAHAVDGRTKMQLTGRDLSPGMRGQDVRRLHAELGQLGFRIPMAETAADFFGQVTLESIERLQREHSLPVTGVVNQVTAEAINRAVGERKF